jgi:hypothetical protein
MVEMWEESVLKLSGLEIEAFGTYILPTFYHVLFLERMQTVEITIVDFHNNKSKDHHLHEALTLCNQKVPN